MTQNEVKKKVLIVFGTRPEAIKMAPLIKAIKKVSMFDLKICVTAQHREMLDSVMGMFSIEADYDLDIMSPNQTINDISIKVLSHMEKVLFKEKPDIILVHGDTTTTMASALAAFYQKIPVGHVEAGLRSENIYSPFPEEMNRRITSMIASYHFAPTTGNRDNLINNGIKGDQIFITGNTVIDALHMVVKDKYIFKTPLLNEINFIKKRTIVLTLHRRENWGSNIHNILETIKFIMKNYSDVTVIYPVHMNPKLKQIAYDVFKDIPNVYLTPPLGYMDFANLMSRSYLVLTDSGGIQEEAPALGKPVLVLRTETERPEAVEAGTVKMAGVEKKRISQLIEELLNNKREYNFMAQAINPYGDGTAATKICEALVKCL